MHHKSRTPTLLAGLSAIGLLAACGGGGGGASVASQGTLRVSMTDAPACGFDAVNVTVSKVRVHQSAGAADTDAGWTDITLSPAKKINLLDLTNGVLSELGQTALPAGRYTQVRLVLDANAGAGLANSVVATGTTTEVALETPSAVQSGIKLVNEFDVAAGQRADLVLDFDACKSVVTRGNGRYALKPVVKVVPAVLNGIDGYVNRTLLGSNVMVTAQQNGTIVSATTPNAVTGQFYLTRLPVGSYDVVITADNRAAAVIARVPVDSPTSTVALSTSERPIDLQAAATAPATLSGRVILNPVSTSDEPAFVTARQSFAAGPSVTIRYRAADLANGSYALTGLPTVAPQLGQYSATLPIALTTQGTVTPGAGRYTVEAGATGYQTQSAVVDVSSGTATRDFTLTK